MNQIFQLWDTLPSNEKAWGGSGLPMIYWNIDFFTLYQHMFELNGVVVISTAQLHSTKSELRFCAGSNLACSMSVIRDGEDLWQRSQLEIRLNAFHWLTIPQKQLIIIFMNKLADEWINKCHLLHKLKRFFWHHFVFLV